MSKSGGFLLGAFIGASAAAVTTYYCQNQVITWDLAENSPLQEQLSDTGRNRVQKVKQEFAESSLKLQQDIRNLKEQAGQLKEQVSKQAEQLKEQVAFTNESLKANETVDKVKGNFAKPENQLKWLWIRRTLKKKLKKWKKQFHL